MQLAFEMELPRPRITLRPSAKANIIQKAAKSILVPANGRIAAYDFALNPYRGCQFGCSYCYAAFFQGPKRPDDQWGDWVEIKTNALELLKREPRLSGAKLYLGSATDPYQPVEMQAGITRSLLEFMATLPDQPRIVVQTRSPLVTRDIDLLKKFQNIRVNFSITTDNEPVRRSFEPKTASIARRIEAAEKLIEAGISVAICVSPMLPLEDPLAFGQKLRSINAQFYTASAFHRGKSQFRSGTREKALRLAKEWNWGGPEYIETVIRLKQALPELDTKGLAFQPIS